jgi:hypothetical protein
MLYVRISIRAKCTTLCDNVCQRLATGQWFSPGPLVSSTNKTDHHDINEILLKVALNTIKQANILYLIILTEVVICLILVLLKRADGLDHHLNIKLHTSLP